jgi:hypothetical protein
MEAEETSTNSGSKVKVEGQGHLKVISSDEVRFQTQVKQANAQ